MILLCVGTEMLARLLRADPRGPDTAWLLTGPIDEPPAAAALEAETRTFVAEPPLAAE